MKKRRFYKAMVSAVPVFALALSLLVSLPAYAYKDNGYNVDREEFIWDVINADTDDLTVKVVLYMMMQPEYTQSSGFLGTYEFWCSNGVFEYDGWTEDSSAMAFHFRPENVEIEDIFEDYQIWVWQFTLEPGTYEFAVNDSLISVLKQDHTMLQEGPGINDYEEIEVSDGDVVILYSAWGDSNWRYKVNDEGKHVPAEPMEALQRYADWKSSNEGIQVVYSDPEAVPDDYDENKTTEESGDEPLEETVTETQTEEKSVQTPALDEEQADTIQPEEEVQEEKKGFPAIAVIIVTGLAAGLIGYAIYRKRKK